MLYLPFHFLLHCPFFASLSQGLISGRKDPPNQGMVFLLDCSYRKLMQLKPSLQKSLWANSSAWYEAIWKSKLITGFESDQVNTNRMSGSKEHGRIPTCHLLNVTALLQLHFSPCFISSLFQKLPQGLGKYFKCLLSWGGKPGDYISGDSHAGTKVCCNKLASIKHCMHWVICSRETKVCWNIDPLHSEIMYVFV